MYRGRDASGDLRSEGDARDYMFAARLARRDMQLLEDWAAALEASKSAVLVDILRGKIRLREARDGSVIGYHDSGWMPTADVPPGAAADVAEDIRPLVIGKRADRAIRITQRAAAARGAYTGEDWRRQRNFIRTGGSGNADQRDGER